MILGFSTAGPFCGAALWHDGDVIVEKHEDIAKGQAERLMPLIEEVLAKGGVALQDLSAVGVGIGPGNFTGIRISVAAARGLALGLGVPAVGVSSLEALSFGFSGPVLTSIAAGREGFYFQLFGSKEDRGPQLVALDDFSGWAPPGLTCVGDNAEDIAARLEATHAPARYDPASAIARIAATRWQDDPPRPAPLYMRPADAAPARDAPPRIFS